MNKTNFALLGMLLAIGICVQGAPKPLRHTIKVGKNVSMQFPSNASTGYSWRVRNDESDAVSSEQSNRSSTIKYRSNYVPGDTSRLGASGHEDWTFTGSKLGTVQVQLEYTRPSDTTSVAEKRLLEFEVVK